LPKACEVTYDGCNSMPGKRITSPFPALTVGPQSSRRLLLKFKHRCWADDGRETIPYGQKNRTGWKGEVCSLDLYMLLRFQKAAVRGNYETGNQAFSKRLRFLTTRAQRRRSGLRSFPLPHPSRLASPATTPSPGDADDCSLSPAPLVPVSLTFALVQNSPVTSSCNSNVKPFLRKILGVTQVGL